MSITIKKLPESHLIVSINEYATNPKDNDYIFFFKCNIIGFCLKLSALIKKMFAIYISCLHYIFPE